MVKYEYLRQGTRILNQDFVSAMTNSPFKNYFKLNVLITDESLTIQT